MVRKCVTAENAVGSKARDFLWRHNAVPQSQLNQVDANKLSFATGGMIEDVQEIVSRGMAVAGNGGTSCVGVVSQTSSILSPIKRCRRPLQVARLIPTIESNKPVALET